MTGNIVVIACCILIGMLLLWAMHGLYMDGAPLPPFDTSTPKLWAYTPQAEGTCTPQVEGDLHEEKWDLYEADENTDGIDGLLAPLTISTLDGHIIRKVAS